MTTNLINGMFERKIVGDSRGSTDNYVGGFGNTVSFRGDNGANRFTIGGAGAHNVDVNNLGRDDRVNLQGPGWSELPDSNSRDGVAYNPVTDTWSTAPADLPTARSSMYGAAAKGNRIYVIGGQNGGVQLTTNEFYTVSADAWSADQPMPSPRAEMGVVSHGGRIYTVGGGLFGISSPLNLAFKP